MPHPCAGNAGRYKQVWVKDKTTMTFREYVESLMPDSMSLPEPLAVTFDWLQTNGHVEETANKGEYYAALTPVGEDRFCTCFRPDPLYMEGWLSKEHRHLAKRVFVFAETGGEGSKAALWLDEQDKVQIVHIGSGSGSIWAGIMCGDSVDFLRLFAIGYEEACWLESLPLTPVDAWLDSNDYEDLEEAKEEEEEDYEGPADPPATFAKFVSDTFGVTIPERGSEICKPPYSTLHDDNPTDPFARWLLTHQNEV